MKRRTSNPGAIPKDLRKLAEEIVAVKAQMREAGLFAEDRELLECPACGLQEDVLFNGKLVTCLEIGGADTGLRFIAEGEGEFRCPVCHGAVKESPFEQNP